jgi:hypothetical protein
MAGDVHDAQLKVASLGKLKDEERVWEDWLTGLHTTLTLMQGVTDVPLIVHDKEIPTPGEQYYNSFDEECVAKAPLSGPAFNADAQSVHLIIKPLVVGENAEQWIQSGFKKKNGRDDLAKLMAHYQGEGNSLHRIYIAENMWRTLHYKGTCAQICKFLLQGTLCSTSLQRMMNLVRLCLPRFIGYWTK